MTADHPRVRVAAITLHDDDILLVQHEKNGERYWLLPGGGVDFGETLTDALRRELKEETNLDIEPRDIVMINDSLPPDHHRHVINIYFTADLLGGDLRVGCEDNRLVDVRFMPICELPDLPFRPDVRRPLLRGLREGFGPQPAYLGGIWSE